jgi:hypothetical protein
MGFFALVIACENFLPALAGFCVVYIIKHTVDWVPASAPNGVSIDRDDGNDGEKLRFHNRRHAPSRTLAQSAFAHLVSQRFQIRNAVQHHGMKTRIG